MLSFIFIPCIAIVYYLLKNYPSHDAKFFSNITLGHRGGRSSKFNFEENTLSAFKFAFDCGIDGIELDVNFTRNRKFVILHDVQSVHRVFEPSSVLRKGQIAPDEKQDLAVRKLSLKELKKCKYRKGKDDKIMTLSEFVKILKNWNEERPFKMMIEVKEWRIWDSVYAALTLRDIYKKYPFLYDRSVVAGFNPFVLWVVRREDPKIRTNLLYWRKFVYYTAYLDNDWPDNRFFKRIRQNRYEKSNVFTKLFIHFLDIFYTVSFFTWLPSFIGCGVIGVGRSQLTDIFIKYFHFMGYQVNCWGVKTIKDREELKKKGVAVTTDKVFGKKDN